MATRRYDFLVGAEQATLPSVVDPSTSSDLITLGWLVEKGFSRDAIHAPVLTVQNCKDIPATERVDKMVVMVKALGGLFYFDSSSTALSDDILVIQPTSGTGRWLVLTGGAGGGSSIINNSFLAEDIDASSAPVAVCLSQKNCLFIEDIESWIDINEGSGQVSVQILSEDRPWLEYDLDTSEDAHDLCEAIKTALNAAAGLALTYDCSYNISTKLISISASNTFSILWKTGAHGTDNLNNHIGNQIGFNGTADDSSATSYTSDSVFENMGAYTARLFSEKTDAEFESRSRNFFGFIDVNGDKMTNPKIQKNLELEGFTGLDIGEEYYTASAAIVVDATNNKINFQEGAGSELTATLTNASYFQDLESSFNYSTLCTEIKTKMEAVGTYTYTVKYFKAGTNNHKFVISSTSGSFTLLWGTGTNASTSARYILGFTNSNTASASSHTSVDNVINSGLAVRDTSTSWIWETSVYVGLSTSDDSMFVETYHSVNRYTPVPSAGRGVFAGSNSTNIIDFIDISSKKNALSFGNLTKTFSGSSGFSSSTRGIFNNGLNEANSMQFITIAILGNTTIFGSLNTTRNEAPNCLSNQTRGLTLGGYSISAYITAIDYVTIATISNASYFGAILTARGYMCTASSNTRGITAAGLAFTTLYQNIEYMTIATTGNSILFGTMSNRIFAGGTSSNTRAVFAGGGTNSSFTTFTASIQYVTISTLGNASTFGSLVQQGLTSQGNCSNKTRGILGGRAYGTVSATIDSVEIPVLANATTFGNLTVAGFGGSCSDSHGGL